jgi:hypothetical protein
MKLTREQTKTLAAAVGLDIPDADIDSVALRASSLLSSMARMEGELGPELDAVEPLPPVFPREDFV